MFVEGCDCKFVELTNVKQIFERSGDQVGLTTGFPTTCWLHSGKVTWQWETEHLKIYFLDKMRTFHCHVSLPEGIYSVFRYWDSPFQRKSSVNKISCIKPFSEPVYPRSAYPQRGFKRIVFIYLSCKEKTPFWLIYIHVREF